MRNDTQVAFRRRSQTMDFPHVPSDPARAELPAALPVGVPAPSVHSQDHENDLGEPIGIVEVARLIGCSVWTVRQRCIPQGLPHFRATPRGKLIFFRQQVIHWVVARQRRKGGTA